MQFLTAVRLPVKFQLVTSHSRARGQIESLATRVLRGFSLTFGKKKILGMYFKRYCFFFQSSNGDLELYSREKKIKNRFSGLLLRTLRGFALAKG